VDKAFALSGADRARYGNSPFGNACLVAHNLLAGKLGPRFIQISYGDWDHHGQIYAPSAISTAPDSMVRRLDAGLGALLADLKKSRLLEETLVVAIGEFGRTVGPLSAAAGRDHWLQQSMLIAGARTRGGRAIGSTDATGAGTRESGWKQNRDIRHEDLEATLYCALGIDWKKSVTNPATGGRFFYVPAGAGEEYEPIRELWS